MAVGHVRQTIVSSRPRPGCLVRSAILHGRLTLRQTPLGRGDELVHYQILKINRGLSIAADVAGVCKKAGHIGQHLLQQNTHTRDQWAAAAWLQPGSKPPVPPTQGSVIGLVFQEAGGEAEERWMMAASRRRKKRLLRLCRMRPRRRGPANALSRLWVDKLLLA